jgi:MOSC domain-containing protein YiiM
MNAKIDSLHLKTAHGAPMKPVEKTTADTGMGLQGDVSYGRAKRQVLLVEKETLSEYGLKPGQTRENVTVLGITLADLSTGTHLRVGDAIFEITGDCAPCQQIDDIRSGLQAAMAGRRGTLCRVLAGGDIRVGDSVQILLADE